MSTRVMLCRPRGEDAAEHDDYSSFDMLTGGGDFNCTEFQGSRSMFDDQGHLDPSGIDWLHGKTGQECEPRLFATFIALAAKIPSEEWDCSSGPRFMLLWHWAKSYPQGIFKIS